MVTFWYPGHHFGDIWGIRGVSGALWGSVDVPRELPGALLMIFDGFGEPFGDPVGSISV